MMPTLNIFMLNLGEQKLLALSPRSILRFYEATLLTGLHSTQLGGFCLYLSRYSVGIIAQRHSSPRGAAHVCPLCVPVCATLLYPYGTFVKRTRTPSPLTTLRPWLLATPLRNSPT
jgi:hypothetical protein